MSHKLHVRCQTWLTASRFHDECNPPAKRLRLTASSRPFSDIRYSSSRVLARESSSQALSSASTDHPMNAAKRAVGHLAKQKEADREFFADLLSSAATKRDAKAYITRLKEPSKPKAVVLRSNVPGSQVNLGNLFGRARALDSSPVFSHRNIEERGYEEPDLHVALVKLSGIDRLQDNLIRGIAQTLSQLTRLGTIPCVVLELGDLNRIPDRIDLALEAERLNQAIDLVSETGARIVDSALNLSKEGVTRVALPKLLLNPLSREHIPILLPLAYSDVQQRMLPVSADHAMLALTREFSSLGVSRAPSAQSSDLHQILKERPRRISLDRVIVIDESGGIPSPRASDGRHIFVNLEQEFEPLRKQLMQSECNASPQHLSNLILLREALQILPSDTSGLMTTPTEASNPSQVELPSSPSTVGTRRQRNTLIHNLLTDRPAHSSSLPRTRVSQNPDSAAVQGNSTFVKRGMPLRIIPDPFQTPWTPTSPRMKLTDPEVDLERLVYLINDSFDRQLDVVRYLDRVNHRMAGIIIAGDYEGGAILTWETPPGVDPANTDRMVPYLDKFAVLKRSQGAGGVADVVFNAMVRSCFPTGVCWRSRKNNLVNKWYFERSTGTWKIPDMNWTMFWTTPGLTFKNSTFEDYHGVCRAVVPTWADHKQTID